MKPAILINPVVRWAVHPAEQGTILYIDGLPSDTLPAENSVITRPFLVDPTTRKPIPVRVVQIQTHWDGQRHILVPVVSREH